MSDYSEYILIYDCDIEYAGTSWWDIRKLKSGNKAVLLINNIYNPSVPRDHIIDHNNYGYNWLSGMVGRFDSVDDAIRAFNNSDILAFYPWVQQRTDDYYLYYGGFTLGWDWTRPYYASKTFNLSTGNVYNANPHPNMKPKTS
jgi:hypothetical protein